MEANKAHTKLPVNPAQKASFLSYIVFAWVIPIFYKGSRKELGPEDLYQPLTAHKSNTLGNRLCEAWEDEDSNLPTPMGGIPPDSGGGSGSILAGRPPLPPSDDHHHHLPGPSQRL